MWKWLTAMASPGGQRGSLSVLFFHRVYPDVDDMAPGDPTVASFDARMGWLQSQFNILPLAEGVRRLREGSLPPAAAAVSFDDGYRDNLINAAPILQRRGIPATFFIATGFLDGGIMFNDVVIECARRSRLPQVELHRLGLPPMPLGSWAERRHAAITVLRALKYLPMPQRTEHVAALPEAFSVELPNNLMLSTAELKALAALPGVDLGAHTHSHPILCSLSDDQARAEIEQGREVLRELTGRPVPLFAYPNGRWRQDFDERHRQMVQACGFEAAFSTEPAVCRTGADLWALPRFTPWDRTALRYRLRMLQMQWSREPAPAHSLA